MAQRRTTAIAVREHGTKKYSKILRFMYHVPESVQVTLNNWVAVSKASCNLSNTLFCKMPTDQPEANNLL